MTNITRKISPEEIKLVKNLILNRIYPSSFVFLMGVAGALALQIFYNLRTAYFIGYSFVGLLLSIIFYMIITKKLSADLANKEILLIPVEIEKTEIKKDYIPGSSNLTTSAANNKSILDILNIFKTEEMKPTVFYLVYADGEEYRVEEAEFNGFKKGATVYKKILPISKEDLGLQTPNN